MYKKQQNEAPVAESGERGAEKAGWDPMVEEMNGNVQWKGLVMINQHLEIASVSLRKCGERVKKNKLELRIQAKVAETGGWKGSFDGKEK